MADYVETSHSNWFQRLGKSVGGVVLGFGLFIGSFAVLYMNEGRLDLSTVAKKAIDVEATAAAPADAQGKLVDIAGTFTIKENLTEGLFLKPSNYVSFSRSTEVYAWVEDVQTETKKDAVGGGETTIKKYSYKKDWVSKAQAASSFNTNGRRQFERNNSVDIDNSPAMSRLVADMNKTVSMLYTGNYSMSTEGLSLPGGKSVDDPAALDLEALEGDAKTEFSDGYVYIRKNADETGDQIGDERVRYTVLLSDFTGTAFGKLKGTTLTPFLAKGEGADALKSKETLYRVFDTDKDGAVETLHAEFVFWTWILRLVGFLMMFIGLTMILDPISTVLDIVGFLGSVSRFLINIVLFVIALVLSIVTIIVSMIAHNIIVLVIVLALIIGLIVFLVVKNKGKIAPKPAQ